MSRSLILKVLSSIQKHRVKCLLMGGQACVLYGAAEFSRDTDLVVLVDPENLVRLQAALNELQASVIAVPPFELKYLEMGLAVHFRCKHPEALNMRVDIMSKMRGVAPFEALWKRRTTVELEEMTLELLSLPDLVLAKKTQRDKDWPMLTRLSDANYFANRHNPTDEQIEFWLREVRSPDILVEIADRFPQHCKQISHERELLALAAAADSDRLNEALRGEEQREREADRAYWAPLRAELERLRARAREE